MVSSILFAVTSFAFQIPQNSNAFVPPNKPTDVKPSNITAEMRGDIFMARKMFPEAIEAYKSGGETAILVNKTGIAYHQLLQLEFAKKCYERAVKLSPQYAEAINNLGTIFYAQKSYRRSITQYKKALRYTPDSASILSNLGTAYFARKNYELAFQSYQEALRIDPQVFEHKNSVGVLLQERTVTERAKFHYYLAKTYAKAGDSEHALIYIRKALEEGFKEREKFQHEPEFALLRDNDEFKKIMIAEQKVL